MVNSGSWWFMVVIYGSLWFLVVLGDSWWFLVVLGGFWWSVGIFNYIKLPLKQNTTFFSYFLLAVRKEEVTGDR